MENNCANGRFEGGLGKIEILPYLTQNFFLARNMIDFHDDPKKKGAFTEVRVSFSVVGLFRHILSLFIKFHMIDLNFHKLLYPS